MRFGFLRSPWQQWEVRGSKGVDLEAGSPLLWSRGRRYRPEWDQVMELIKAVKRLAPEDSFQVRQGRPCGLM